MTPPPAIQNLPGFAITTAWLFAIIGLRYILVAGAFYWVFYRQGLWPNRKIRPEPPDPRIVRREMAWSGLTSLVFAVAGAILLHGWRLGHTRLYGRIEDYGWGWFLLTVPVLMVLHETYFYWTHRWIHHPRLFRRVHHVHHESFNPTPWAAFSFHPLEAVLQAAILPALVWVVPTHLYNLGAFLVVMTVLGVINHVGYEIYPQGAESTWFGRQVITGTHHFLHHSRGRGNFGLYFTFWDRWMKTQHPDSEAIYRDVTSRPAQPVPHRRVA